MGDFHVMLAFATATGGCILAGGLLARIERIRPLWLENEFRHSVIAFGGGALIAAVALVLVPEGMMQLGSPWASVSLFLAGGLLFFLVEAQIFQHDDLAGLHRLDHALDLITDAVVGQLDLFGDQL